MDSSYIKGLSEVQREAAISFEGPSLIVAGAGSGKTRVLTCRIAYMIDKGIDPSSILALTFTNKAAAEMRERIGSLVSVGAARRLWMGTFHSMFLRILRAEAETLGYPSSFTIYDTADSRNVVKAIIKEMNLSDETYKVNNVFSRISLCKNNLIPPQAYEANTSLIAEDRERKQPQFAEIYKRYAAKCRANGAMDFDDLLLNINILFRDHPQALDKYRQRFRYILVDEYQDTNLAQYAIIRKLGEGHSNVCVVGDDAQSIYSFRGAKIENILRFQNDFPKAKVFKLEQNYRSTRTIVDAANCVIKNNKKQLKKNSFSSGDKGELIRVHRAYTDKEEASRIASEISSVVRNERDTSYGDVAVLYRTNAQSRAIEDALRLRNIPYRIWGGTSFYQRKEIKDLLAYFALILNTRDDEAFKRIINYPARGLGDITIGKISARAAEKGISMWEAASSMTPEELDVNAGTARKITSFTSAISELSLMRPNTEAYKFGVEVAMRSGILPLFKGNPQPESVSALENIEELLNSISAFEKEKLADPEHVEGEAVTIDEWLQNIMLLTDMDNEEEGATNKVTLMTVHAAKGLEFQHIFITGLEENLFPSMMAITSSEGIEEERRLFYVALTRAKRSATLTFSQSRFKWGEMSFCTPSRFLKEIDPSLLDVAFDLDDDTASPKISRETEAIRGAASNYKQRTTYYPPKGEKEQARPSVNVKPITIRPSAGMKSLGVKLKKEADDAPGAMSTGTQRGTPSGGYSTGMKVLHDKFGDGVITAIEPWNGDQKITVDFGRGCEKTLLGKFAKLTVIG